MVAAQMCEVLNANFQEKTHTKLFSFENLQKYHQNPFKTTQPHKKRYCIPISLYSNNCITFQLILSGDIETNSGPNQRVTCCEKIIRKNSSRYDCQVCRDSTHVKCLNNTLLSRTVLKVNQWTCICCFSVELPFRNTRDLFDVTNNENLDDTIPSNLHLSQS